MIALKLNNMKLKKLLKTKKVKAESKPEPKKEEKKKHKIYSSYTRYV